MEVTINRKTIKSLGLDYYMEVEEMPFKKILGLAKTKGALFDASPHDLLEAAPFETMAEQQASQITLAMWMGPWRETLMKKIRMKNPELQQEAMHEKMLAYYQKTAHDPDCHDLTFDEYYRATARLQKNNFDTELCQRAFSKLASDTEAFFDKVLVETILNNDLTNDQRLERWAEAFEKRYANRLYKQDLSLQSMIELLMVKPDDQCKLPRADMKYLTNIGGGVLAHTHVSFPRRRLHASEADCIKMMRKTITKAMPGKFRKADPRNWDGFDPTKGEMQFDDILTCLAFGVRDMESVKLLKKYNNDLTAYLESGGVGTKPVIPSGINYLTKDDRYGGEKINKMIKDFVGEISKVMGDSSTTEEKKTELKNELYDEFRQSMLCEMQNTWARVHLFDAEYLIDDDVRKALRKKAREEAQEKILKDGLPASSLDSITEELFTQKLEAIRNKEAQRYWAGTDKHLREQLLEAAKLRINHTCGSHLRYEDIHREFTGCLELIIQGQGSNKVSTKAGVDPWMQESNLNRVNESEKHYRIKYADRFGNSYDVLHTPFMDTTGKCPPSRAMAFEDALESIQAATGHITHNLKESIVINSGCGNMKWEDFIVLLDQRLTDKHGDKYRTATDDKGVLIAKDAFLEFCEEKVAHVVRRGGSLSHENLMASRQNTDAAAHARDMAADKVATADTLREIQRLRAGLR